MHRAGDKAEPGRMNFSSVSREASLQHRGVPLFSVSVRAEEEAILVVSGGLTFKHSFQFIIFLYLNFEATDEFKSKVLTLS